mmetsp:Transcript_18648/g.46556  ORF Transcript_18648/g.46556 Transcript_18648/m.46556 type:complete len:374 (-) Transcript_18648:249-1370(-)|eukprot:g10024.t1
MADLSWHQNRIREGARGGQEQFQWDSVKGMSWKDREVYLGASQKVGTMGRYGNFSRSDWWRHERGSGTTKQQEQQAIREFEDELMQEALGQKPKKLLLSKQQLTAREMQMALAKDDPDQAGAEDDSGANIESAKGLGFAVHRSADLEAKKARLYGMNDEYEGTGEATEGGQQVNGAAGGSSSSTSSKFEPVARIGGAGAGPQEGEASAKEDILRKYGAQQSASVPNGEQLGSNGGRSPRLFGEGGGEEDEGGSAKKTAAWSSTFPPAAGGPKSSDVPMVDASSEPSPSKEMKKPKLPKAERRALKQQKREAKKQKKARKKLEKKEKKQVKKEKKEAKTKAKRRKYEKKHRLRDSSSEDSDSSSGSTSDSSSRS